MHETLRILICICAILLPTTQAQAKAQKKKPNVIYILADDLGIGDLSAFNPESKIKTKHLDAIAADGMRFTNAHTSSSVCTPTRYGILTGRYNWRSRIKQGVLSGYSNHLIPKSRATVASVLKRGGYQTAFIGKWHLGWDWAKKGKEVDFSKDITNGPNSIGFDYSYSHSGSLDMAPYVYVENRTPTAVPKETKPHIGSYAFSRKGLIAPDFDMDDVTPNFFRRSIEYVKAASKRDKPFFLYLALPSPHTPILPNKPWQGKSGLNPYADFVLMIDDYMGMLHDAVKQAGIEEDTIIIFTADNGCSPTAKFDVLAKKDHDPSYKYRGHKADIYEGGHRVAFIVKWPAKVKAGSSTDVSICTTDLVATVADINGISLAQNEAEDSFSMLPLLEGKGEDNFGRKHTIHHSINGSFAISQGKWKLILAPGSAGWSYPRPKEAQKAKLPPIQLYDLSTDVAEKNNVYAKHPKVVSKLYALLMNTIEQGRQTPGVNQKNDPSNKKRWPQLDKLRKLKADGVIK